MPKAAKEKRARTTTEEAASSEAGPSTVTPKLPPLFAEGDEEDDKKVKKRKSADGTTEKKKKKKKTPGIVYISRIPPGMTPHKVRHLMEHWGEVGRVFAQPRDAPTGYNPHHEKKKEKRHKSADYTEAWVEYMDKSIAKLAASMMNAQPIGGRPGDKWRDDIWTMKYLSGFKWEMLGEQIAYERNVHQSRLRNEIQRSKTEQNAYLKNVELAHSLKKREEKRAAKAAEGEPVPAPKDNSKAKRTYKQREVIDRAQGLEAKGMDSVLGNIFG